MLQNDAAVHAAMLICNIPSEEWRRQKKSAIFYFCVGGWFVWHYAHWAAKPTSSLMMVESPSGSSTDSLLHLICWFPRWKRCCIPPAPSFGLIIICDAFRQTRVTSGADNLSAVSDWWSHWERLAGGSAVVSAAEGGRQSVIEASGATFVSVSGADRVMASLLLLLLLFFVRFFSSNTHKHG